MKRTEEEKREGLNHSPRKQRQDRAFKYDRHIMQLGGNVGCLVPIMVEDWRGTRREPRAPS